MKSGLSLTAAFLVLGLLILILYPNPLDWGRKSPEDSAQRKCFANQRVLEGALREYQNDHPGSPITGITPEALQELVKTGYLKNTSGLSCYYANRKRQKLYLLESLLSVFSPLLVADPDRIIVEPDPVSGVINIRCLRHGKPG